MAAATSHDPAIGRTVPHPSTPSPDLTALTVQAKAVPVGIVESEPSAVTAIAKIARSTVSIVADRKDDGVATGSGFIVSESGYLVTNNHVVGNCKEVGITLPSGNRYPGIVVGRDPASDLAVVKIQAKEPLTPVTFADSDTLKPGEQVIAYGHPLGLSNTATAGIVSAIHRPAASLGLENVLGFIQVDAPINPGNSGGPLVNLRGEVVGINSAKAQGEDNLGFAIPATDARRVIDQIIGSGFATHSKIGVAAVDASERTLMMLRRNKAVGELIKGVQPGNGALVVEVEEGSSAERAGLKIGDKIIAVDGVSIANDGDLRRMVAQEPVGTSVQLSVDRGGRVKSVTVQTALRDVSGSPFLAIAPFHSPAIG
jgi:S1-C subfamily serine protease